MWPIKQLKQYEQLVAMQEELIAKHTELQTAHARIAALTAEAHARELKAAQDIASATVAVIDKRFLEGIGVAI
ncbi:MAG TPA: hypothetical protein VH079_02160 [Terriglobales bacterium]|jgi:hypothetical protein|nr:hypothetical protein [Terriglobales bacterium]